MIDSHNSLDFDFVHSMEYVEANGLGGYAAGTFSGAHSRRYHGLLVASLQPPVERQVVVSKIDETIVLNGEFHHLGCNQFPGTLYPFGVQYLSSFQRGLFPEWTYRVKNITLKKSIAAIHGSNTTVVLYDVIDADEKFTLDLQAFYSCRDFHSLSHVNDHIGRPYIFEKGVFRTMNYQGSPEFFISVPRSSFTENQTWYRSFEYVEEQRRGMDFEEDLYTHGKFSLQLRKGSKLAVVVSLTDPTHLDGTRLFREEKKRREKLIDKFSGGEQTKRLVLAADQFVVRRDDAFTIIAGYPWFSDRGRDTMISITGLCLVTGKHQVAKKILQKFPRYVSEGMLPNRFPDYGEAPQYDTIDVTLWYFHAVYKFYRYTNDKDFVRLIIPTLRDIIDWHYRGTRHNTHVDKGDELLSGGEPGVQLTWMDAKIGDWIVTPRNGKAVEVNALWYNALCVMRFLMSELNHIKDAEAYQQLSTLVERSFHEEFWNDERGCLFDYVDGDNRSTDVRPNQLYAIGLPFPVLKGEHAVKVLEIVRDQLLTPRGLRSLSPLSSQYKSIYQGGVYERDSAYHQGTVWSYLIGIYIDALFAVQGEIAREEATQLIKGLFNHLDEAGLGSISEVFDGDPPHRPGGCVATATSVAELLRVITEYRLDER